MILQRIALGPDGLMEVLEAHDMVPDVFVEMPGVLAGAVATSEFYALIARGKPAGIVWLSDIVPGLNVSLHIFLASWARKMMRPDRVRAGGARDSSSRGKLKAFDELMAHCFGDLKCERVTALIPERRKAAQRLAHRVGLKREARIESAARINGKVENVIVFGLTKENYHGRNSTTVDNGGSGSVLDV